ncbi:unnamed protein product [Rotaria socialis]|nr:unnamed protein product [Rotaria socialis]
MQCITLNLISNLVISRFLYLKKIAKKAASSTRDNHYQFTVLPQGITNGPATFQRVINHILGPARWKYPLAYIDDIIIYSKTFEEHLLHLNEICTILKDARFPLNPDKCEIVQTQTDYLGDNIKNGEIRPSPHNINDLLNTRLPQAADLHLQILQTDASDEGIGAVLLQTYPEGDRPIAYLSKKFSQAQRKWSLMEQECYAFICALDKWHNYLSGTKFTWETDHKALTQLNKKAKINKRCEQWRLKILEYDYKVKYIPGLTNYMPDYLSRSPVDDAEEDPDEISFFTSKSTQTDSDFINSHLPIVTDVQTRAKKLRNRTPTTEIDVTQLTSDSLTPPPASQSLNTTTAENRIVPISTEQLIDAQQNDDYAENIINNIKNYKNYIIKNNLLMRLSNTPVPYLPQVNGGHFGRNKTIHKIKQRYFWLPIKKTPSKLKPINPPDGVWQLVSMDFHGPITPTSQREDIISKFGTPRCILTDNGTHFTSILTNELFMLSAEEYNNILWKLDNIPSTYTGKSRQNYPTSEETLNQISQTVTTSFNFTLDTESMQTRQRKNKPVLIQIQALLSNNFSIILIFEMCHLPREHTTTFYLIKNLLTTIFNSSKPIYIWGERDELTPFAIYNLFSETQLLLAKFQNLQDTFKEQWQQHVPHLISTISSSDPTSECLCEQCIGKNSHELWSLQDAVNPQLFQSNLKEQQQQDRQKLSIYAASDCLSMQHLLIQTQIITTAPTAITTTIPTTIHPSNINRENLEPISFDDTQREPEPEPEEQQFTTTVSNVFTTTTEPIHDNDLELISSDDDEHHLP